MLPEERYEVITKLIEKNKIVKVPELIKIFNVSVETVRRDLEYLEKEGYLKRVYGGAVFEKVSDSESILTERQIEHVDEKMYIASLAVQHVNDGQSIIIDMGTTTLEFAKELKNKVKKLTVITNSMIIAKELSDMDDYTIILTGGVLRKDEFSLSGYMTERLIEEFHIDVAFLTAGGISIEAGITDYDMNEVQVKKKMIKSAEQVIVLADSSKFNVKTLINVCGFKDINLIITDNIIKNYTLIKYVNEGIQVINK